MNIFKSFWHLLEHLFPGHADAADSLLTKSSQYINKALPIVEDIDKDLKATIVITSGTPTAETLTKVESFVSKYEKDVPKVQSFISKISGKDAGTLLRDVAVFCLSAFVGGNPILSRLLNYAVEFAYNLYEEKKAKPAPVPAPAP